MKRYHFLILLLILAASVLGGGCLVQNPTQDSYTSPIPTTKIPVTIVDTNITIQDCWEYPLKGGSPYHIEMKSSSPVYISMWGPGSGEETIFARYASYNTDVLMAAWAEEVHICPVEQNEPVNVHIKIDAI